MTIETKEPFITHKLVQDPLMSDAEFIHQKAENPDKRNIGKVHAQINLTTLLGGFCRFKGSEAQNKAISRFKASYENSQIGASQAIDYAAVKVDTSGLRADAVFEFGADSRGSMIDVQRLLSNQDYRRLCFVVIGENGPTAYARFRLRGEKAINGQVVNRLAAEVYAIADILASFWGFMGEGAKHVPGTAWDDGSPAHFTGDVVNPKRVA